WNDGLGTAFAPGYWNKIAQSVAADQGLDLVSDARLFALLNIATADALISCWDAKYTYSLWRPVTSIPAADTDGNPDTGADATWTPLLVTPNFPSYTSAHSTVSAAAAAVLTALFGPDHHFTVAAESVPGVTRSFDSFGAAAAEAGQSRIYGGIHYPFDNQAAQASGHAVGRFVVGDFLLAVPEEEDSRPDDPPGGEAAFRAGGLARLLAGPSDTAAAGRGVGDGPQGSAPAAGPPRLRQPPGPTEVPAAPAVARDLRVLDQALAD